MYLGSSRMAQKSAGISGTSIPVWCHMWVQFCCYSEGFSPGFSAKFPPSTRINISKFQFNQDRRQAWKPTKTDMASFHETDAETEPAILYVYLLIYLIIYFEIDSVPTFRFFFCQWLFSVHYKSCVMSEVWLVFNDARSHQGNRFRSLKWQAHVCKAET